MTQVNKIDSNITGLRYAAEDSLGVLPGSPVWKPMEPNTYSDFGGQLKTKARKPINPSRQNKKGVVVDLDASGGVNQDLTQTNLQELLQGFMFADFRERFDTNPYNGTAITLTGAVASSDRYTAASGLTGFVVNTLMYASGFDNSDNNGLKVVDESATGYVGIAGSLVDETPPSTARLVDVGYQFVADEVDIDVSTGSLPRLVSTLLVTATGTLTLATNVADGDTVTIGTTIYAFESGTLDAAYKVKVGATASDSIDNLIAAINGAAGSGTLYDAGTAVHPSVSAAAGAGDTMVVSALLPGAQANTIATTEVSSHMSFAQVTLTGGVGKNLLDFDLVPGQWLFIGGDSAGLCFTAAEDNGFKRVKSISATGAYIEFDKSFLTMTNEASVGGKTVQLFLGRVLKNETGDLIVRRSFQFERTLGAPDSAQPADLQAEYLVGSVASQLKMDMKTADILVCDLSFISTDNEQHTATDGLKSGSRPALVESDAFNTTSDFSRIKLASVVEGDEAPDALFAYATEFGITIDNNLSPNKAISVLGAFDITAGTFQVSGNMEVYFSSIESVQAVRDNADITLDFHLVKANAGVSCDIPLITLGDGRAKIELDQPIKLPLTFDASTAAKVDANMDHTLLYVFYDYLPDLAG